MDYLEFLQSKIDIAPETGIEISPDEANPALKPHQRDGVLWAVRGGRRALFEAFGLGKTVQELEFCRLVLKHKGGRALKDFSRRTVYDFRRHLQTAENLAEHGRLSKTFETVPAASWICSAGRLGWIGKK